MTFELRDLSRQLDGMVGYLNEAEPGRQAQIKQAWGAFGDVSAKWQETAALTRASKIRYVTAVPLEDPAASFAPISLPEAFSVIATDGSQIEPERHALAHYFVLNVGWAGLHYGPGSHADLGSAADIRYRDDQLWFEMGDRRIPIREELLATLRSLEERRRLAALLEQQPKSLLTLGLADGALLDWTLDDRNTTVPDEVGADILQQLDRIRDTGHLLASYISRPSSREAANLARVGLCSDRPGMNCQQCSSRAQTGKPACEPANMLFDAVLMEPLPEYHRSALFEPLARAQKRYPGHEMRCFYINTGVEIGRVEVPVWVAEDPQRLALTHALVADQCRRGRYHGRLPGYPPALIEAHEQAVVDGNDRIVFNQLLERRLFQAGLPAELSAKRMSKQMKAV